MRVIKEDIHKANKEHICNYCGGIIPKGTLYSRATCIDDTFYVWKSHQECEAVASEIIKSGFYGPVDGFTSELFKECVDELYTRFYTNGKKDAQQEAALLCKAFSKFYLKQESGRWRLKEREQKFYGVKATISI